MSNVTIDRKSEATDALHLEAYNTAFYELGLSWHWDSDQYRKLMAESAKTEEGLRAYLEAQHPHMLKAYDVDFLIGAIEAAKKRCLETMSAHSGKPFTGVNWAQIQTVQVGH